MKTNFFHLSLRINSECLMTNCLHLFFEQSVTFIASKDFIIIHRYIIFYIVTI